MATLVLSAVGTAIGGPVGGALGSMIGQAIDTNLFGPGPRRGPRLDDLKVQTSSYGTQIPRIYGRMRVAGTIVWATDLKEAEEVDGGGKGNPETIHYNYSCSFAVALSSRPIDRLGRIWADGKLIRGEAGDLKVKAVLRVLRGTEDQAVDPLIAALEGAEGTPAYRGLALAVFEDLELSEFGNRLPMLTFEVVADDGIVAATDVVGDVGDFGIEGVEQVGAMVGFAAMGTDRRSAIEGLADLNGLRLAESEDGVTLIRDGARSLTIDEDSGWSSGKKVEPVGGNWAREAAVSVPQSLSIRYHEPARDYQAGLMRAFAEGGRGEALFDSAAALSADVAKSWASGALSRRWAGRDRLNLSLSTNWIDLKPGDQLNIDRRAGRWTVEEVLVEAFAVKVACRRSSDAGTTLAAEAGRSLIQPDVPVGESVVGMFEVPSSDVGEGKVRAMVAVSCAGSFKRVGLTSEIAGAAGPSGVAWRKARLGIAENMLGSAPTTIIDRKSAVVVRLVDASQVLLHADDDALDAGANLAMLGEELLQFGRADALEDGRYRLSHFLRGRGGTERSVGAHAEGEVFVMIDSAALVPLDFDAGLIGHVVRAVAHGVADGIEVPPMATRTLSGAGIAPLSPCHLTLDPGAQRQLRWVPRSRSRWVWDDGSDTAVGAASYAVDLNGSAGSISRIMSAGQFELDDDDVAALGPGEFTASVRELGAWRASEAATAQFMI